MRSSLVMLFIFILPFTAFSQNEDYEYIGVNIITGEKPECMSCNSAYNLSIDNFLRIDASGSSDIVIKIMNNSSDECIRTVFPGAIALPNGVW